MIGRRELLAMLGGGGSVGDFTQYEKKTVTFPGALNGTGWEKNADVTCSFTPKYVLFYADDDSNSGEITYGAFVMDTKGGFDVSNGFLHYISLSSGEDSSMLYAENSTGGNARFYVDSGHLHINRASANGYWSNSYNYTFEFYG